MKRYKYLNRNPSKLHTKDCVCRAISSATGLNYDAVDNLLTMTANEYDCDKLCLCCYHNLLEEILCYRREECEFKVSVEELAERFPYNVLLMRVDGHLTCSVNGVILDIWDCSDELVDCYWIIK